MMYAAMLAGIAFNAAGCHLPHGLSYAVSAPDEELARARLSGGQDARAARHGGRAQQSVGVALHGAARARRGTCTARAMPRRATRATPGPTTRARCSRGRVIELMRATGMPNGLSALGFDESHVDALATGAEPQYRVIKNAPVDVGRDELKSAVPRGAALLVARAASPTPALARSGSGVHAARRAAAPRTCCPPRARSRRRARPGGAAARA